MNVVNIHDIEDKNGERGTWTSFLCADCGKVWEKMVRGNPFLNKCPDCHGQRYHIAQGIIHKIQLSPKLRDERNAIKYE